MFCPNCGKSIPDNSKFCSNCRCNIYESLNRQPTSHNVTVSNATPMRSSSIQPKRRKPWYARWYVWFLMILGTLQLIVIIAALSSNPNDEQLSSNITNTSIATLENETESTVATENISTEAPSKAPATEAPSQAPEVTADEFKASCEEIDYATLSRNPDKYKGNNYVFTGQVIQVVESTWLSDTVTLRINVTEEPYEYIEGSNWTDTIYATVEIPDGDDRILEEDIITFWGTCDGLYTYTGLLGNSVSVPKIDIKYYELSN